MATKQVHINIYCDEGHVADSLRELANAYEENNEMTDFETYLCVAEIN